MGKLGRKICCNFDRNVKCILLSKGHKHCIFEETTKQQQSKGEIQLGICALLPESEGAALLTKIKKERFSKFRSWKD